VSATDEASGDVLTANIDLSEPASKIDSTDSAVDKICISTVEATYNLRQHIVGEVYTGPDATADVIYNVGSSSTVGVGFSTSGDFGTFSASGTATTSSSATENFPRQDEGSNVTTRTHFGWRKYHVQCTQPAYSYYEVKPYEFQAGQVLVTSSIPTANNCVNYPAGRRTHEKQRYFVHLLGGCEDRNGDWD